MKVSWMQSISTWGDQDEKFSLEDISKLERRWTKCIKMKGDYIEK